MDRAGRRHPRGPPRRRSRRSGCAARRGPAGAPGPPSRDRGGNRRSRCERRRRTGRRRVRCTGRSARRPRRPGNAPAPPPPPGGPRPHRWRRPDRYRPKAMCRAARPSVALTCFPVNRASRQAGSSAAPARARRASRPGPVDLLLGEIDEKVFMAEREGAEPLRVPVEQLAQGEPAEPLSFTLDGAPCADHRIGHPGSPRPRSVRKLRPGAGSRPPAARSSAPLHRRRTRGGGPPPAPSRVARPALL